MQQCAGQPFQADEVEVAAGRRQVQDHLFIGQAHQGHAQWGCPVTGLVGEPGQRGVLVDAAVLAQVLEIHRQRAGFVNHLHRVAQAGHGHQARAQEFTAGHQGLQAVVQCSDVQRLRQRPLQMAAERVLRRAVDVGVNRCLLRRNTKTLKSAHVHLDWKRA
ncbi:hypothetical protein D3C84_839970 [compost metagenome]